MRPILALATAALLASLLSCTPGQKSASGFRLPDGDVERGKATFLELKCTQCHTVFGMDLPRSEATLSVALGGEEPVVRTDGELVTSIINPSHKLAWGYPREQIEKDGKSRMRDYSDVMTVRQMTDLVAFLHSRHKYVPPRPVK
jgi:L-cysteine S-thiosulfotransferase